MNDLIFKKLGDFSKIIKGKNPTLLKDSGADLLPYLSAKYLRGIADAEFASRVDKKSVPVEEGDIVIICDGSNSGEIFSGSRGILSSTMGKLVHDETINVEYLAYFLEHTVVDLAKEKTGTAIPHLDIKSLLNKDIYLPDIVEQKRIAGILKNTLSEIEKAKENIEKNLNEMETYFFKNLLSIMLNSEEV